MISSPLESHEHPRVGSHRTRWLSFVAEPKFADECDCSVAISIAGACPISGACPSRPEDRDEPLRALLVLPPFQEPTSLSRHRRHLRGSPMTAWPRIPSRRLSPSPSHSSPSARSSLGPSTLRVQWCCHQCPFEAHGFDTALSKLSCPPRDTHQPEANSSLIHASTTHPATLSGSVSGASSYSRVEMLPCPRRARASWFASRPFGLEACAGLSPLHTEVW